MILSALVMGVAVLGMHHIGMAAAGFIYNEALPAVPPMGTGATILTISIMVVDSLVVLFAIIVATA